MSLRRLWTESWRSGNSRFAIAIIGLFLLLSATASAESGASGLRDPVFSQVPFDQWRSGGKQSLSHWSVELVPPELSSFQRIVAGVKIQSDGREFPSHAVLLVEFEDAEGGVWQTHSALGREPEYSRNAFVLPGDYYVSVAIYDPATLRHSFTRKKLHVAQLKADPLPNAWDGLPRVEFLPPDADLPDSWLLPTITSQLHLPVHTQRPLHVDILLNSTPGENTSDPTGEMRRNMSVLIPILKVVSNLDLGNGSLNVELLDLTRRRVSFEQRNVKALNWGAMKELLARTNPDIVDVHALDGQWKMRSFFLDEVGERIRDHHDEESARIVIVLSGPAFFKDQEPAGRVDLPADPARRVFYIRCRAIPRSVLAPRPRPRPGVRPRLIPPAVFQLPLDDLERPLDASHARLFDVITPEQFRRVLAAIIGQISRL
jgi:hypothetical protein